MRETAKRLDLPEACRVARVFAREMRRTIYLARYQNGGICLEYVPRCETFSVTFAEVRPSGSVAIFVNVP